MSGRCGAWSIYARALRDSQLITGEQLNAMWLVARAQGLHPNPTPAPLLFEEAIKSKNHGYIVGNVASLLTKRGNGVPVDIPRAVEPSGFCIGKDDCYNAMFSLRCILSDGADGVPRDVKRAVELYEKAIAKG
ncbi:hypothetical protein FGB62_289g01 [Gracilaria domingensis]|nr:hypothetical protein FGB62_289g01 [Gracilaria domingensis]